MKIAIFAPLRGWHAEEAASFGKRTFSPPYGDCTEWGNCKELYS